MRARCVPENRRLVGFQIYRSLSGDGGCRGLDLEIGCSDFCCGFLILFVMSSLGLGYGANDF
jgi:hypothetical protein